MTIKWPTHYQMTQYWYHWNLQPSFRVIIAILCWQLGQEACVANTLVSESSSIRNLKHFAKRKTVDMESSRSSSWYLATLTCSHPEWSYQKLQTQCLIIIPHPKFIIIKHQHLVSKGTVYWAQGLSRLQNIWSFSICYWFWNHYLGKTGQSTRLKQIAACMAYHKMLCVWNKDNSEQTGLTSICLYNF